MKTMIKIITIGKVFKSDISMEVIDEFMQSNQQLLKLPTGEWINRSAIMSIEVSKNAYWDGWLLDDQEKYFMRDGKKVLIPPQAKKEIYYEEEKKEIIKNKILAEHDYSKDVCKFCKENEKCNFHKMMQLSV